MRRLRNLVNDYLQNCDAGPLVVAQPLEYDARPMTFQAALKQFGTVQKMADALGVTHQALYKWKARGQVPKARIKDIRERAR